MESDELLSVLFEGLQVDQNDSVDRPFVDVVGDSLRALQVSDHVFERLGIRIDLGVLYSAETVRSGAQLLADEWREQRPTNRWSDLG